MKILLTGGTGFLGRNLMNQLLKNGNCEIVCFDRYAPDYIHNLNVEFLQGDINEHACVEQAVSGCDAVVHMACTVLPKNSNQDPGFDVSSNIGGSIQLLEAAVKNKVKRFVFLSSGGTVYGVPKELPITETHPNNPECSYGITKLAIEKYMNLYRDLYGLSTCSLRLANPYGEYQRVHSSQGAIPVFCYLALTGQRVQIWGDGSVQRDFVYIQDVVDAIIKAVEHPEVTGEINIGSGIGTSLNELLENIEAITGRKVLREYLEKRNFDVPVNVLDNTKAKQLLNWNAATPLNEGLRRTLDWIKENEVGTK